MKSEEETEKLQSREIEEGSESKVIFKTIKDIIEMSLSEPIEAAGLLSDEKRAQENELGVTEIYDALDGLATSGDNPPKRCKIGEDFAERRELMSKIITLSPEGIDLVKFKEVVNVFYEEASTEKVDFPFQLTDFVDFLYSFGIKTNYTDFPEGDFRVLLGGGSDYNMFRGAAKRLYQYVFFQQTIKNITFYDISLLSNIRRLHFQNDKYLQNLLLLLAKGYFLTIGKGYTFKYQYTLSENFVLEFSSKLLSLINAFNGLISELDIDQEDIPKIILVIAIFSALGSKTVMMKDFGDTELFYCAVRIISDSIKVQYNLENLIRNKLYWNVSLKFPATLGALYSSIFFYEYCKYIGNIMPARSLNHLSVHRCSLFLRNGSTGGGVLTTSVIKRTPKKKTSRAVQAFSPLSRKIAEANKEDKDSFDSKRKLSFD